MVRKCAYLFLLISMLAFSSPVLSQENSGDSLGHTEKPDAKRDGIGAGDASSPGDSSNVDAKTPAAKKESETLSEFADDTPLSLKTKENNENAAPLGPSNDFDVGPILMKMAIGLAIFVVTIAGLIWFVRRNPKVRRYVGGGTIEVLSRNYLGSRYAVFLLKIGERILVVGQGPDSLHTLSEINDTDEVTRLLATIEEAKPESVSNTFRDVLSSASKTGSQSKDTTAERGRRIRSKRSTTAIETPAATVKPAAEGENVMVDSKAKLAAIREQLDKNRARLQ